MMKKICVMAMFLLLICSICTASFTPPKMKIGDVDGQWTYIGRYGLSKGSAATIKDFVVYAQPFQTEKMNVEGLRDVYFYHVHGKELYNQEDGVGCARYKDYQSGFNCVLKMVPLDKTGKPLIKSGPDGGIIILSITGHPRGPQQIFRLDLKRCRLYDAISHQLIWEAKDEPNSKLNSVSRKTLNNGYLYSMLNPRVKEISDNMYQRAARMGNCPIIPEPKYEY